MNKLLKIGYLYTWQVIVFILSVSVVAAYYLPDLRLEITAEGMMVKDDPSRVFYEKALQTFGSDNVTIIYFEDENLFERNKLLALQKAVKQLDKSPLIDRTVSLFSVRHIYTRDGFTYTDPYFKRIPETQAEIDDVTRAAKLNPLVVKNIISENGKSMAINVFLNPSENQKNFDASVNKTITDALQPLQGQFSRIFYIGDPYVRDGLTTRIKDDLQNIIPVSVILLVLSFAIVLRQFKASFIPLLTSSVSIVWTLGLMAALDIPINVMTSIIPALLIIIGSTEDIHLLAESGLVNGDEASKRASFERMADNMWLAVLLTFITTYLGFLSISLGNLDLLQQFGLVASTGLVINFLITVLMVPLLLKLFDFSLIKRRNSQISSKNLFRDIAVGIYQFAVDYQKFSRLLILAVVIVSVYFASRINVNNNVMDYFDSHEDIIVNAETLHENLSGIQTFSIVLSGSQGAFLQVPYLQDIWDLQDFLRDTGYFDSSFSFADFIGVIHAGLDSEWSDLIYLPSRNEVVREYMSLMDQSAVKSFVSSDFSQTRLLVRHNMTSSDELARAIKSIESYAQSWMDPNLQINVTGENYLNSQATDYLAKGQYQSLALILSAIFLIVSGLFMNIKAGLIAVLANLLPIVVLFGVMGWQGIAINTGTSMVAAISLGVCVDYTMHFMVRYQRLSKRHNKLKNPLYETFREESVPIMSTALALSAGFLTLSLSDFPPVAQFGQLSALVVIVALFSTFIVTALLLQHVRLITVWDILSMDFKRQVLHACSLFKGMSNFQAKKIIALSEIHDFAPNELINMQGMTVNQLYVVLDGHVEGWRTKPDGSSYRVSQVFSGGVFGVLLPDTGQHCFADMIAVKQSQLMVLKWENLHQISRNYPRLAMTLFKNISLVIAYMLQNADEIIDKFHDESSGALSAAVFTEVLDSMVKRANRYDEELSVICVQTVFHNDYPVHEIIRYNKLLGYVLKNNMRGPDSLGRIDQSTLCIACAKTSIQELAFVKNRIIDEIAANDLLQEFNFKLEYRISGLNIGESFQKFFKRIKFCESD